jgi:hypothetical protein
MLESLKLLSRSVLLTLNGFAQLDPCNLAASKPLCILKHCTEARVLVSAHENIFTVPIPNYVEELRFNPKLLRELNDGSSSKLSA